MDNLILHSYTKMQLVALLHDTPHALALIGPKGIGKCATAQAWASLLTAPECIMVIEPDEKGTISIDTIRMLYQRTRSKQRAHQVVIIDRTETLGTEAQNAFLKLLEEPRKGVTFVLTAPSLDTLLPTIVSRTQHVLVQKVSQQALLAMIPASVSSADRAKLLFMADGRPAVIAQLLNQPDLFKRQGELMQKAKQLITANAYRRLATVQELTKNKDDLTFVLEAMAFMLKMHIGRDPSPQYVTFAEALNVCLARLAQNGNARAQLTHLFTTNLVY